ncbi:MAG TPA: 16S rRNA (guanine(966)-N(2))-methyltransferase RsmD [Tepidisphaeraceae bacterium]|nr:16S rRNA (guanine(966)-N(2))-methyltransferase RsmD [Tepidisphaeraceae bacterium]
MRIIAGKHRGRKLLPPEGDVTRPITDRVKQSLFDILAPLIPDAVIYDCFAGTGSMGLECLSRGAKAVTFFEADRSAVGRLKRNIAAVDDEHCCEVVAGDLFRWFANVSPGNKADLIFLDPPYRFLRERCDDLRQLAQRFANVHLAPGGTVIFRHDANDSLELPGLQHYDLRQYGGMTLEFLSPKTPGR